MRSNILRYYIDNYRIWIRISIRARIHKRQYGRAMGCLCEYFWENWPRYNGTATVFGFGYYAPLPVVAENKMICCDISYYAWVWQLRLTFGFSQNGQYPMIYGWLSFLVWEIMTIARFKTIRQLLCVTCMCMYYCMAIYTGFEMQWGDLIESFSICFLIILMYIFLLQSNPTKKTKITWNDLNWFHHIFFHPSNGSHTYFTRDEWLHSRHDELRKTSIFIILSDLMALTNCIHEMGSGTWVAKYLIY